MPSFKVANRIVVVTSGIIAALILFVKCVSNTSDRNSVVVKNYYGETFAGSQTCRNCHADIYKGFSKTAHHLTSAVAKKDLIAGSFEHDKNSFYYNYYEVVRAEDTDSGLYQIAYYKGQEKEAKRFDIIIGSGVKGQTYLYWNKDRLFQLPLSYFTGTDSWVNSPGYPSYRPFFNRPVTARCMECHGTYVSSITDSGGITRIDKNQIIYGVECESCHGPAQRHVEYQSQHPGDKTGKFIVNPALLSRQQQLDQCALCHSGMQKSSTPAFTFLPGDTLANFFKPTYVPDSASLLDVHGNKYALLSASKCFRMSGTLTCNTCHNTHVIQRNDVQLFSKKCMTCHKIENGNFCRLYPTLGSVITKNCIDCHMPLKASKTLTVELQNQEAQKPAMIRSHYIAIYPKESAALLKIIKEADSKN